MKNMVISFNPDGAVQHTLKDSFFDTRFLGNRKVNRMSDIKFSEKHQAFYITLLKVNGMKKSVIMSQNDPGKLLLFPTYEAAVEFEIEFINGLRKKGVWV